MNKVIIIIFVALLIFVIIGWSLYGGMVYKNGKDVQQTLIKTFLMYVPDTIGMGQKGVQWSSAVNGQEPISCPVGTKINIIDAVFEPYDPYATLPYDSGNCVTGKFCLPDVPDSNSGDYSGTSEVNNTFCKIQDATPYLINKCNGIQTCSITSSDSFSDFFGNPPVAGITPDNQDSSFPPSQVSGGNQSRYYIHGLYTCIQAND